MKKIGRKIFFDIITGNIVYDTGERFGSVLETSVEQDVLTYKPLSERNRNTFDVLELPYGAYEQEFTIARSYRVDPESKKLEFQHTNESEPEIEQPYQTPLIDQIAELKKKQQIAEDALLALLLERGSS